MLMIENSIDAKFLEKADEVRDRSPCFKSKVGAVIVLHGKVVVTGYNSAPRNQRNCAEIGWCYRIANEIQSGTEPQKCRAFGCHAEGKAIAEAARKGIALEHGIMYVSGNTEICPSCRGLITNAGIKMVVYKSKHGVIEKINVDYDWGINILDQERKLKEWVENTREERNS